MGLPKDILEDWLVKSVNTFNPSFIGSSRKGTRKISGQLLSPPLILPSSTSRSSSSAAPPPLTAPYPDAAELKDIEVPVSMFSEEALQFIGFDARTSRWLLNKWVEDELGLEVPFQDMIFGYLDEACVIEPQDWRAKMSSIGLSQEFQDSLMDPEFTNERATRALAFWIREFTYENFLTLEGLSQRVQKSLEVLKQGHPQLRGGAQDRSDYHLHQAGHTTLYRATSAARLAKVFDDDKLQLQEMCLGQPPPSDFSVDRTAYYWSPQHWVAENSQLIRKRIARSLEMLSF